MQSEANLCLVDQGHCFVWRSFSVEEKYLSYETVLKIIGSQNKDACAASLSCCVSTCFILVVTNPVTRVSNGFGAVQI